jgi:hypothetical protein
MGLFVLTAGVRPVPAELGPVELGLLLLGLFRFGFALLTTGRGGAGFVVLEGSFFWPY